MTASGQIFAASRQVRFSPHCLDIEPRANFLYIGGIITQWAS
jgi:hypothetical protein